MLLDQSDIPLDGGGAAVKVGDAVRIVVDDSSLLDRLD